MVGPYQKTTAEGGPVRGAGAGEAAGRRGRSREFGRRGGSAVALARTG
jgi:hypothetical protein